MKILLLLPFGIDSHQQWAKGLQCYSRHEVRILSMGGSHWKWRMHGAALTLARKFEALRWKPDLILSTDMMDLSTFAAMLREEIQGIPLWVYFHENQLTYLWSARDPDVKKGRDRHYAWINFVSALVADRVLFNSYFHKNSFLDALPRFLRAFPDHQESERVTEIQKKSYVCYPGIDLESINRWRPSPKVFNEIPIILWNHRWEYDKNPELFFRVLYKLAEAAVPFRLVVLGKGFSSSPKAFAEAQERLARQVIHWGFVESKEAYLSWLWKADVLPVSSYHDFFGISVLEAILAENFPLLPMREAYPEHLPPGDFPQCYYKDEEELFGKLKVYLTERPKFPGVVIDKLGVYDIRTQTEVFDSLLEAR